MLTMLSWALGALAAEPLPELLPEVAWTPPATEVRTLSNGVPVWILGRSGSARLGIFELWLVLSSGEQGDPAGREGLGALAMDLADEGAGDLDAAALSAAVRAIGAELSTSAGPDLSTVRIRGLSRSLDRAVELWSLPILSPRLSDADLELLRQRHVDRIQLRIRQPDGASERVADALEYGLQPPTEASLAAIDREAVATWWAQRVVPGGAAVIAGGDLDPDALMATLEARLGGWAGEPSAPPPRAPIRAEREAVYLVDVPHAPQTSIRAFVPTPGAADPGAAALEVANEALGGAFTSRINLNLREDKGWTYGARCRTEPREGHSWLSCQTLVRADVTGPSLAEMRRELADVIGDRPLGADEVDGARAAVVRSWPVERERLASRLRDAATAWRLGLPPDQALRLRSALGSVTRASADAALRAVLAPDRVTWVVAGDLAAIRGEIEALGLPLVEPGG